jgi:hypothetical protein
VLSLMLHNGRRPLLHYCSAAAAGISASQYAVRVVQVEVRAPLEYQGSLMGDLNRRRGMIQDAITEADDTVITAQVWPDVARCCRCGPLCLAFQHHCVWPPCNRAWLSSASVMSMWRVSRYILLGLCSHALPPHCQLHQHCHTGTSGWRLTIHRASRRYR